MLLQAVNVTGYRLIRRTLKLGKLTNFKTFFPVVLTGFSVTGPCQKLKKPWKGLLMTSLLETTNGMSVLSNTTMYLLLLFKHFL